MRIIILILLTSTQLLAKLPALDTIHELPAIDVAKEMSKSSHVTTKGKPLQYAVSTEVNNVSVKNGVGIGGQWDQLKDGSWIWRFEVYAQNALSLDFGLYDFYMPPTAELSFYDWSGDLAKGPFTDRKNKPHKQLWPGTIIGDNVTVELTVADKYKPYVSFSIKNINRGFRSIWDDVNFIPKMGQQKFWKTSDEVVGVKSGSCNVDVVCDDGDGWRDQIRSVARYTAPLGGCTGQMVNNTANNGKPLFLTANHCGFNSSNAASINIWWNYESNMCRTPGSTASGTEISISDFNDTQSGATFLASYAEYDFALLELDDLPDAAHVVFYTGWDRSDVAPNSVVAIHHPQGHAKRISFENDPTSIISNAPIVGAVPAIDSHIRVADWDIGTTEGGSSGGGLWNSDKLLVGQLQGGGAACGNNDSDYFGRLSKSWEGGGTPSTRLKDWLDPNNTSVQTLQGLGECIPMSVTINHNSSSEEIGVLQNFSALVSGGVAPHEFKWDVNSDSSSDGAGDSISTTYSHEFVGNVTVEITDADGCTSGSSKAVVIQAPEINLLNTGSGTPVQVCGNNDTLIDPGERWRVPVSIQNNGFTDAENAYAVFTKNAESRSFNVAAKDNFGNTLGSCNRQFIDISNSGTNLNIIDSNTSDNFPATDEGVAAVSLTQSFDLYGQTINGLYLSTNGFISTNPNESGYDFDNDCPLPTLTNNSNNGSTTSARIIPLHADLITQHIYHQHFSSCPRPANGNQDLSCDVFMYKDVDRYDSDIGGPAGVSFNFEAILYPEINLWVYQYDGTGFDPTTSTIGLQNDNATDGAAYACNTSNSINTQEAVCVYHKNFSDTSGGDDSKINLETPIIALGDMPVSEQKSDFVTFSIDQDAQCGSPIGIKMQAGVYESGFNQDDKTVLSTIVGTNDSCSVVSNCSVNNSNDIQPTNGLWFNAKRSGNGNDMYFLDSSLVYVQYTALEDRSPIWYITGAEGYYQNNQAYNNLNKHEYNGPFLTSSRTITQVGESHTTLIDANNAIQTRTINGKFSADLMQSFIFSSSATSEQRTGLWYNASESGWGATIGTQGDAEVVINYLFDNVGQPYWVLGSGNNAAVENIDMNYIKAFCPHCPSVPTEVNAVGNVRINYDSSNTSANLENLHIDVKNEDTDSQWDRTNLPITLLTPQLD